jgi:hypothetical protein
MIQPSPPQLARLTKLRLPARRGAVNIAIHAYQLGRWKNVRLAQDVVDNAEQPPGAAADESDFHGGLRQMVSHESACARWNNG